MRAEVKLGPVGTGSVVLDGVDVSGGVAGVSLDSRVGQLTRLRLELPAVEFDFSGAVCVEIPAEVHDALVALGWTPPGGADG